MSPAKEYARHALAAALAYAADGVAVLPCQHWGPKAKAPLNRRGYKGATCDAATIRRWWKRWPLAMVAIVPPRGVVVLDVDPRNGGTLNALERINGGPLPPTLTARTGSGGWHLYYLTDHDGDLAAHLTFEGRAVEGIDVKRGATGYLIAPPSIHPTTGGTYEWARAHSEPVPLPQRLSEAARRPHVAASTRAARMGRTPTRRQRNGAMSLIRRYQRETCEGRRNIDLFSLACLLWTEGHGPDVFAALESAALSVGLNALEIAATIASARRHVGVVA